MDSSAGTHCHQSYVGIPAALAAVAVQYMGDTGLSVHCDCYSLQLNWHHCQIQEGSSVPEKGYN
jgi:hypothetical protein